MGIAVRNVSKHYGSFRAVDDVSLEFKTGSLVALLGPSGSGKSTLLRMIAGLETPTSGEIYINGKNVTHKSVQKRNIGFMFQHYALFKHLTVRENIAFALELRKSSKRGIQHRVEELLELVKLSGFAERYPSQLSGGQRQRVALARALAVHPETLLLDEPFGALDAKVRKELRIWLRHLHEDVKVTTLFVTHDQEEAMEVADQIVVMNKGKVEQVGNNVEIYDQPATPFVMSFIGPVNILSSNTGIQPNKGVVNANEQMFLRPHDILIHTDAVENGVLAKIDRIIHLGWEIRVELLLKSGEVVNAHLSRDMFDQLQIQENQDVYLKPKQATIFQTTF